jgi:hypothetical protein
MESGSKQALIDRGFVEITAREGDMKASAKCSGGRSDCCTRVCSADQNYTDTADAWEQFLDIEAGEIQY